MKAKISPTSPRADSDKIREITEVYNSEMSEIKKPIKNKSQSHIWLLLVVVILGFFAGVISQLVLMSYGQNFPVLSKLGIFNGVTQIFTVTSQKSNTNNAGTTAQLSQVIAQVSPAVVTIYRQSSQAGDLTGLLADSDRLGVGLVITEDGYLVTLKSIVSSNTKLVVSTSQNKSFPVQLIISDPSSDFIFLKIASSNLSVVPFTDQDSISLLSQVEALSTNQVTYQSAVKLDHISSLAFQSTKEAQNLITSSDIYSQKILLSGAYAENESKVVFSENGGAIGIMEFTDGNAVVVPFGQITPIIDQLSTGKIHRPILGIRYLDLSATNSLSSSLTYDLTVGALIISDDEKSRPSVIPKSPAQKAGLQKGDIITAVDGQTISSVVKLNEIILAKKVGDTITIEYNRHNIEKEVKITLTGA